MTDRSFYHGPVRVGLVSPYSYTYPGGVGRHVEALAEELLAPGPRGSPPGALDPDDRQARATHRGVRPQASAPARLPDPARPHGRPADERRRVQRRAPPRRPSAPSARSCATGATTSSTCTSPTPRRSSWFATEAGARAARRHLPHLLDRRLTNRIAANVVGARRLYSKLHARIAVSEAARWTAQRFYGGDYRVIPNGVDLRCGAARARPHGRRAAAAVRRPGRGAQGAARAAARLRGAARRGRSRAAHRGRRHRRGGRAAAARPRGRRDRRPRLRRGEVAPARRGRPARGALARRRELRHGADRGIRLRHARGLLRHRRLPRRGARWQ